MTVFVLPSFNLVILIERLFIRSSGKGEPAEFFVGLVADIWRMDQKSVPFYSDEKHLTTSVATPDLKGSDRISTACDVSLGSANQQMELFSLVKPSA